MNHKISYSSLVLIEEYLTEDLKQLDGEVFMARKYAKPSLENLLEDREALREAIAELTDYETYIANHG